MHRLASYAVVRFKTTRSVETEPAPICYGTDFPGVDTDSEQTVRWLIALMVLRSARRRIARAASSGDQLPSKTPHWSAVPSRAVVPRRSRVIAAWAKRRLQLKAAYLRSKGAMRTFFRNSLYLTPLVLMTICCATTKPNSI
jgi:hypothetical protein